MKIQPFFAYFLKEQEFSIVRIVFVFSSVIFILSAPQLVFYPWIAVLFLCLIVLFDLFFSPNVSRKRRRVIPGPSYLRLALIVFVQGVFVFAGQFFSDDSLRHVFDGFYLLRGVDVYSTPPLLLSPVCEALPNHPQYSTIYFPFTQALAAAGSWISPCYGFFILFALFCAVMIAAAWFFFSRFERRIFFYVLSTPWWLIESSSRHSDLCGFLIVMFLVAFLRNANRRGHARKVSAFWLLFAGLLAGCLPVIKPEGSIWFLLVFYLFWRTGRSRLNTGMRTLFSAGAVLSLSLLCGLALAYIRQNPEAPAAFYKTGRLYSYWFVAYNPFVLFRIHFLNYTIPDAVRSFRTDVFLSFVVFLVFFPGMILLLKRFSNFHRRIGYMPLFVAALLGVYLFGKGTWQPWYFAWWFGALFYAGWSRFVLELMIFLPLFYIPTAFYRAGEGMPVHYFYLAVSLFLLCRFFLTKAGRQKILQMG